MLSGKSSCDAGMGAARRVSSELPPRGRIQPAGMRGTLEFREIFGNIAGQNA
jgi:hypothetical protein